MSDIFAYRSTRKKPVSTLRVSTSLKSRTWMNIGSVVLVVTRTVVGGPQLAGLILLNPAAFILKTYSESKNFKRKVEMCKFA